jgi:uncharacterized protein YdeI (YjbR/CyaY-like superfamily)
MEITKTLYLKDRKEWRSWLKKNFNKEKEIWLIYYKKKSGIRRIPYNDAVEEALCFGWIDSIVKKIDDEKYAQRFTQRSLNSVWSDSNIIRIKKLIAENKITKAGFDKIKNLESLLNRKLQNRKKKLFVPKLISDELKKHDSAWKNFLNLPPSHKRMYVEWIMSAKQSDTKIRRISKAIGLLNKNKRLGML